MKTLSAISTNLCLLMVLACPALGQTRGAKIDGNWLATLDVGGVKHRLLLKIQETAEGYKAKLDSVDQGVTDLPVDCQSGRKQNAFCRRAVQNEL